MGEQYPQAEGEGQAQETVAPTALGKLRRLVEEKTRFEPNDITPLREESIRQPFVIAVAHHLQEKVEIQPINGFFAPSTEDISSNTPLIAAQADIPSRRCVAAEKIAYRLQGEDTHYNSLTDGLILAYSTKYWYLNACGTCTGRGHVTCQRCAGTGEVDCSRCSGSGKEWCSVPYQQSNVHIDSRGYSHTTYSTVYRDELHSCPRCSGMGHVTCATCSGNGIVACAPCCGTGKTGEAAWTDIYTTKEYTLEFPDDAPKEAGEVRGRVGVHAVAGESAEICLTSIAADDPDLPATLTAMYGSAIQLTYLDARCNDREYHLVAFGKGMRWHRLDGIVESLLRSDLDVLRNVLADCADDPMWDANVDKVLAPLNHVAASELNADIVEATLSGKDATEQGVVVSPEYASQIQNSLLGALRLVYNRAAKQFWWKTTLAGGLASATVWAFSKPLWAGITGLAGAGIGSLLFDRKVRKLLDHALGGESKAHRAIRMASGARRNQVARSSVFAAPTAVAIAMWAYLPATGPLENAFWPALEIASADITPLDERKPGIPEQVPETGETDLVPEQTKATDQAPTTPHKPSTTMKPVGEQPIPKPVRPAIDGFLARSIVAEVEEIADSGVTLKNVLGDELKKFPRNIGELASVSPGDCVLILNYSGQAPSIYRMTGCPQSKAEARAIVAETGR